MPYTKSVIIIILCFLSLSIKAQDGLNAIIGESAISLNHNASKEYSMNFAFRSRYFLYDNERFQYQQQQVDIYHFSTFKLNFNHKLSFGIYYRNRDWFDTGSDELRFTEQFNYTKQNFMLSFVPSNKKQWAFISKVNKREVSSNDKHGRKTRDQNENSSQLFWPHESVYGYHL